MADTALDLMAELGAIWYEIATNGEGHKDRDCHFVVECSFSYGEPAYFEARHYGYVDDGFGHCHPAKGASQERRFSTFDAALAFCIDQTLAQLRRHHPEMTDGQIERAKAVSTAWKSLANG